MLHVPHIENLAGFGTSVSRNKLRFVDTGGHGGDTIVSGNGPKHVGIMLGDGDDMVGSGVSCAFVPKHAEPFATRLEPLEASCRCDTTTVGDEGDIEGGHHDAGAIDVWAILSHVGVEKLDHVWTKRADDLDDIAREFL